MVRAKDSWGRSYPCGKTAKVQRAANVKKKITDPLNVTQTITVVVKGTAWFCGMHDPEAVQARDKKRREAEETINAKRRAREEAKAVMHGNHIRIECLNKAINKLVEEYDVSSITVLRGMIEDMLEGNTKAMAVLNETGRIFEGVISGS